MAFWKKSSLIGLACLGYWLNTIAQPLTRTVAGKWIGVHTAFDNHFFCALPTYFDLRADGTFYLGMVDGTATPKALTWEVKSGLLRLDALTYTADLVSLKNDLLTIGQQSPMLFRRFQEVTVDSLLAFRMLNGKIWETDSLRLSMFANGKLLWENRRTNQRTVHCWRLAKLGTSVFLVTRGNARTCDGDYKPLWQLVQTAKQQFRAVGWNGLSVATETFRLVRSLKPMEEPQASDFQLCNNCFRQSGYSFAEPTPRRLEPKLYSIKKAFEQLYKPVAVNGQSGLIQVRFAVNCNGERGMFNVKGFDENYQSRTFDPQITEQLLAICRQDISPDWRRDPASNQEHYDTDILLNFRLKDGVLIDIFL